MERTFTLEYWLDENWYVGRLKEVLGVFSQGETLRELEENIQEVHKLIMESKCNHKITREERQVNQNIM